MFPSNLNYIAIKISERTKEYSTRDREPEAEWPEIVERIRTEVLDAFRYDCFVSESGHEWVCKDRREFCNEKELTGRECSVGKLCKHCNIWQELVESNEIPDVDDTEADRIITQNEGLFKEIAKDVALARAYAVLHKINAAAGMVVPLEDVKKVLKLPAFDAVAIH